MILKLVVKSKANCDPAELTLSDESHSIGRMHDNDLSIQNDCVSGYHAKLTRTPEGGYTIKDLKSSNGTFLNGKPVSSSPEPVNAGDDLKIGNLKVAVEETFENAPVQEKSSESDDSSLKIVSLKDMFAVDEGTDSNTYPITPLPGPLPGDNHKGPVPAGTAGPAKVQSPLVEPPRLRPPKAELPKVEPAKLQPPIVEPSNLQPPKAELPIVEPAKLRPPTAESPQLQPPNAEAAASPEGPGSEEMAPGNDDNATLLAEISKLKEQLAESERKSLESSQNDSEAESATVSQLQKKITEIESASQELQEQLEAAEEAGKKSAESEATLREDNLMYLERVQIAEGRTVKLEHRIEEANSTLSENEELIEKLQEKLREAQSGSESGRELQSELDSTEKGRIAAEEQVSQLKEKLASIETESREVKEKLETSEKNCSELEEELARSLQSHDQFEEKLARTSKGQSELEKELAQSIERREEIEEELAQSSNRCQELEEELAGALQSRNQFEEELARSLQSHDQFEEKLARTTKGQSELEKELAQSIERREEIEEELTQSSNRCQELEEELAQSTESREALEEELAGAIQSRNQFEEELARSVQSHDQIEEKLVRSTKRCQELEEELAQSATSREALDEELARSIQSRNQFEEELARSLQSHDQVEEKLARSNQSYEELKEELTRSNQSRDEFEKELAQFTEGRDELEEELARSIQSLDQLKEELAQSKKSRDELESARDGLGSRLQEHEKSIADLARSNEELECKVRESGKEKSQIHRDLQLTREGLSKAMHSIHRRLAVASRDLNTEIYLREAAEKQLREAVSSLESVRKGPEAIALSSEPTDLNRLSDFMDGKSAELRAFEARLEKLHRSEHGNSNGHDSGERNPAHHGNFSEGEFYRHLIAKLDLIDSFTEYYESKWRYAKVAKQFATVKNAFVELLEEFSVSQFDMKPGTSVLRSQESRIDLAPGEDGKPPKIDPFGNSQVVETVCPGYVFHNGTREVIIRKAKVLVN